MTNIEDLEIISKEALQEADEMVSSIRISEFLMWRF